MLKEREIQIIKETVQTIKGRKKMVGNAITLLCNDELTLRTNGDIIYGLYKHTLNGEKYVKFSHDVTRYDRPYIANEYYADYKDLIYAAWKKCFYHGSEARTKYNEVLQVINSLDRQPSNEPIKKQETKIEEPKFKEELTMENINVMVLAHKLRKEMRLEGHYHAQMKIALKAAWSVIKGQAIKLEVKPAPVCTTFEPEFIPAPAPVIEENKIPGEYIFAPVEFDGSCYKYALKHIATGKQIGGLMPLYGSKPVIADSNMKKVIASFMNNCPPNTSIVLLGNACMRLSKVDQSMIKNIRNKGLNLIIDPEFLSVAPSGDAV